MGHVSPERHGRDSTHTRPLRLARPRTPPFHGGDTGSNPVGDAKFIESEYPVGVLRFFIIAPPILDRGHGSLLYVVFPSFPPMPIQALNEVSMAIEIRESDIKVEFYRASGPGGQHRNTTDSAVRIRHLPTGIVAQACESRSQTQNRETALKRLQQALERLERKIKKRIATNVPRRAKEKRLSEKRITSEKKRLRSGVE